MKLTRRFVFKIIFSTFFSLIFIFINFPYQIIYFFYEIALIIVLFVHLLLYPSEWVIKEYYLKKAKKKMNTHNYFVIGITGSYAKTTLKTFLYSFLSLHYRINDINNNYNTLMGICKYINEEISEEEILILELGIDKLNSMKKFKKLLSLDLGIITNIGPQHLTTFKSIENIAKEKFKIQMLMKRDAKLFLLENVYLQYQEYVDHQVMILKDNFSYFKEFYYYIYYKNQIYHTRIINKIIIPYLFLVINISEYLSFDEKDIIEGIIHLQYPARRNKVYQINDNIIIDDSYNINIDGALALLKEFENRENAIVLTNGIFECGNKYHQYNQILAKELLKFSRVIIFSKTHIIIDEFRKYHRKIEISTSFSLTYQKILQEKNKIIILLCIGKNISLS